MPQFSKATSGRGAITRTIDSTAQTNADEAAKRIEPMLFPNGVPDPLTLADVMLALAGLVKRRYTSLETAEVEVGDELKDDEQLRTLRDEQMPSTREQLMATRSVVDAHWGSQGVRAVALEGPTPEVPDDLVLHGRSVTSKLASRLNGVPSRLNIAAPPLDQLAADLTAEISHLETLLDALDLDVRETQNAQNARIKATSDWDSTYSPAAGLLEHFFRLAGMDAQADRVRPTTRRRTGRPEPEDLEDEEQGDDVVVEPEGV